jgi:phosphoglycerate dehydrogenase-like enzyme
MAFKMVFLPPHSERVMAMADEVATAVPEATVVTPESEAEAEREIVDADAAFGTISPRVLSKATKLRWLQAPAAAPAAGYYHQELVDHPVVVTNLRGIFNDRIAPHILTYVLMFARGFHAYVRSQARKEWRPLTNADVIHLPESTALIVGVGEIGAEAARLCSQFGIRVIGVDARRERAPEGVAELHRPEALDALLPRADFVILTVPHTPETEGFFGAAKFKRMKKSAYFINIGRGKTTRLDDLDAALRAGTIAGAGLDVYEIEPLPADHPLWDAPNTILTPHSADRGPHLDERRLAVTVENARRFAAGEPLKNVVDKARWF